MGRNGVRVKSLKCVAWDCTADATHATYVGVLCDRHYKTHRRGQLNRYKRRGVVFPKSRLRGWVGYGKTYVPFHR